ncbi:MAG TPA: GatB/YqeY domain-containing protein [Solirubrobacteraceae bacterium]|nr:GatB/YqeY domain-containing protein [Solirubrobacteraceae bacterium]
MTPVSVADQIKSDLATAMKAGERERVGALRLVLSELQKAVKDGHDDELAVLRRERKRRIEAAEQFGAAGREELAVGERAEAVLIESYLPAEIGDDELDALVAEKVAESGAENLRDIGRVMALVMPAVNGRADGKRVSAKVREALADA